MGVNNPMVPSLSERMVFLPVTGRLPLNWRFDSSKHLESVDGIKKLITSQNDQGLLLAAAILPPCGKNWHWPGTCDSRDTAMCSLWPWRHRCAQLLRFLHQLVSEKSVTVKNEQLLNGDSVPVQPPEADFRRNL